MLNGEVIWQSKELHGHWIVDPVPEIFLNEQTIARARVVLAVASGALFSDRRSLVTEIFYLTSNENSESPTPTIAKIIIIAIAIIVVVLCSDEKLFKHFDTEKLDRVRFKNLKQSFRLLKTKSKLSKRKNSSHREEDVREWNIMLTLHFCNFKTEKSSWKSPQHSFNLKPHLTTVQYSLSNKVIFKLI